MTAADTNPQVATPPRSRVEGAFTALAAGDALGWPQEFMSRKHRFQPTAAFREWERRSGGRFYPHTETIRAGEYSDDTQLTLAVARSRLTAGASWWQYLTRKELPLWTLYERGGGGATKRAANSWLRGEAPWKQAGVEDVRQYFEAGGNGVAMRVLPHAVFHAGADDPSGLLKDVLVDGAATHGHPRALVGAAVYAFAAWWLLRAQHTVGFGELLTTLLDTSSTWGAPPAASFAKNGWFEAANNSHSGYSKLWDSVVAEMQNLLRLGRQGLEEGVLSDDVAVLEQIGAFSREKGSGTVSAATAIYLSTRYAAQPVQAVLRAAFALGSDTDTLAAMTGGLVGALVGSDWLPPEWSLVQDSQYIRKIANKVAAGAVSEGETLEHPVVTSKTLEIIVEGLVGEHQGELDLGGTRRARVLHFNRLSPLKPSITVVRWQLETSDGQTIYVTKIDKKSPKEIAQTTTPRRFSEHLVSPQPGRSGEQVEGRAGGIKISVKDISASTAFYEQLGLSRKKTTKRFVSFGALSLVDLQTAVDLSNGAVTAEPPNHRNRIELHVNDLNAIYQRLVASGTKNVQPIVEQSWGERSFHCVDPEGNLVEVIERHLVDEGTWRR